MTALLENLGPGFCRELEKLAMGPELQAALQRGLGGVGAGAGVGALAGAGIGAVRGYRKARREGQEGAGAVFGGLGGALKGALPGAALGAAGLGAVQAAGLAPGLTGRLTGARGPVGAFARSGQRQVHGLTGWTPRGFGDVEGARQIGLGSTSAQKALEKAWASDSPDLARQAKRLAAAHKAEQMGLSSVPGFAKSLVKHPLETIGAGVAEQVHESPAMTAMALGLPAAAVASELHKKGPEAEGRGKRIAGQLGNVAMMPLGLMPAGTQMALQGGVRKLVGKLRPSTLGQNPAPPETNPMGSGLSTPIEHQYSDRASGQIRVGENTT